MAAGIPREDVRLEKKGMGGNNSDSSQLNCSRELSEFFKKSIANNNRFSYF